MAANDLARSCVILEQCRLLTVATPMVTDGYADIATPGHLTLAKRALRLPARSAQSVTRRGFRSRARATGASTGVSPDRLRLVRIPA